MPEILPYEPEPAADLKARYPEALKKLWNAQEIRVLGKPGPDLDRTYVFDFEIGLRLIISIELAPTNPIGKRGPFEHVSATFHSAPPEGIVPLDLMIDNYSYISGRKSSEAPIMQHLSENGVYHMLFKRLDMSERDFPEIPVKKIITP